MNRKKIKEKKDTLLHFITYDIWRITNGEVSKNRHLFYKGLKATIITIRSVKEDQLNSMASALTYKTLLSTVPLLAVIFAIARGFGFQDFIDSLITTYFSGKESVILQVTSFANNYLEHSKTGVFMGVGIVLLLYTVINLISTIEISFNKIWQVKKSRSYYRKITDYFSLVIIVPIFIIVSTGVTLLISASLSGSGKLGFFNPVVGMFTNMLPYMLTIVLFLVVYITIPNTKVKIIYALIPAVLAGIAFQIFQTLYINGQIFLSKYNAIYGSFAALPLFLLWLQFSWIICLFGVQLCYTLQNINRFSFESDTKNISRRYLDFLTIVVATLIIKRLEKGEEPYTSEEISEKYKIPIKLTNDILRLLISLDIIKETPTKDDRVFAYIPGMDTHTISISVILKKIDENGSENFKTEKDKVFRKEWDALIKAKSLTYEANKDVLLRDF